MSEKTILVIDDSATIRRLVDSELSSEGYRVILAPTAEDGVQRASEESPDLILLDHQLPGTTGFDVCCQLLEQDRLKTIPVVISSTLRKKAYAEYTELSNVVDMLPKPYTPDLLRHTIVNALDTASIIVESQQQGTAVPEVIDQLSESDLAGTFATFGIREILDFLNNAEKCGMLEVDAGKARIAVFLDKGRIQAVTGSGVDTDIVASSLPSALVDLAPMIKLTVGGRNGSEVDGLVELLDNKVLDSRLLRQLLRHQAAVLLKMCFEKQLISFRFESDRIAAPLFRKLPLDISLLALLVEAALLTKDAEQEPLPENLAYARNAVRGQNLDRAGLSGRHMKLFGLLSKPMSVWDLQRQSGCEVNELVRVLEGFEMAELVRKQECSQTSNVLVVVDDEAKSHRLTEFFSRSEKFSGKVAKDLLSARLVLRRSSPDVLAVDLDSESAIQVMDQLKQHHQAQLPDVQWLGFTSAEDIQPNDQVTLVRKWSENDEALNNLFVTELTQSTEDEPLQSQGPHEMADCI